MRRRCTANRGDPAARFFEEIPMRMRRMTAAVLALVVATTGGYVLASPPASWQLAMMDGMGMGGMPMKDDAMKKSADPSMGGMGAMPAADPQAPSAMGGSGMDMMGKMRDSGMQGRRGGAMAMKSALPGFPGASRLYHVGATDFFLDHPQHITLSVDQQSALNRVRERTLMDKAATDRRIEQAEQELFQLTGADSPDAARVEVKVREIEKLRADARLAYIRAVGEAARQLTAEQRSAVLGTAPQAKPGAMSHSK
jgi:Spy/CpxP family protein refolding chaperone